MKLVLVLVLVLRTKKKKKKLVQTKPNQNQVNKSGTIIKIRNRKIQEPFDRYSDLALWPFLKTRVSTSVALAGIDERWTKVTISRFNWAQFSRYLKILSRTQVVPSWKDSIGIFFCLFVCLFVCILHHTSPPSAIMIRKKIPKIFERRNFSMNCTSASTGIAEKLGKLLFGSSLSADDFVTSIPNINSSKSKTVACFRILKYASRTCLNATLLPSISAIRKLESTTKSSLAFGISWAWTAFANILSRARNENGEKGLKERKSKRRKKKEEGRISIEEFVCFFFWLEEVLGGRKRKREERKKNYLILIIWRISCRSPASSCNLLNVTNLIKWMRCTRRWFNKVSE